ncbi:hypothetical protein DesyoDRAFT_1135 [Desulfosporosinus youngiae DSM 17734]|uniref:Uncharacterized protein n=2 Tax=Desulfosporosinus TaxID=79206 RepID=H5Y2P2_9FIRM|nr:hypothetical protein DesyoDRAFT_1135 [Desulfosporosinus youngiae DSM 17734]
MLTYTYCKKVIENTTYTSQTQKDEILVKLDVFLLNDRINDVQYQELSALLAAKSIAA